jgi:hypothetical protein
MLQTVTNCYNLLPFVTTCYNLFPFVADCSQKRRVRQQREPTNVVEHKGMCHTEGLLGPPYRVFTINYMCHIFAESKEMSYTRGLLGALCPLSTITYVWHISSVGILRTLGKRPRRNQ